MRSWLCGILLIAAGAAPVCAGVPVPPPQWNLLQNDPDPVCPNPGPTRMYLSVAQPAHVRLEVLAPGSGPVLRTLIDSDLAAGLFTVVWDGLDGLGGALPDAIYPYHMVATIQGAVAFEATKYATLGCVVATAHPTWSRLKSLYE